MEKIVLTLSNDQQQEFDLSFNLMDNSFVPKWISCLKEAKAKGYPISEPWAMYNLNNCLLYTSPSPRDKTVSRMPSSA